MKISRDLIFQALDDADLSNDAVREEYSGRGMYGRSCPGFEGSDEDFRKFLIALSHLGEDGYTLAMQMTEASTDSMGKSDKIFYWRNLTVTD